MHAACNYRLSGFGWAALGGDTGNTGNLGLRDMVACLQWVQTNVAAFGGDPTRVTLQG